MPTIVDQAICIRHWDFSETSQTVSLLTREHGVVRGLAKGAKREKGHFSGGIDVLTRGEAVAIVKPGGDLATLTAWHLQEIYRHLRHGLAANRAAQYAADLVHHMLLDHDPHPAVYDRMDRSLQAMSRPERIEPALLRLQWTLLGEAGYQPELHRDAQTGQPLPADASTLAFSTRAGGVVADTAAGDRWRVRRETVEALRRVSEPIEGDGEEAADDAALDPEAVRRANRLLAVHFREIIGSEPSSMRWAFSDLTA